MRRIGIHGAGLVGIGSFTAPIGAAAAGWWVVSGRTVVAAYQPKGAASYAASLVNLANPGTYDAYEGTAPSWNTATGWTFNGSTQRLLTGITHDDAGQNWSMIARYTGATPNGARPCLMGEGFNGPSRFTLTVMRFNNTDFLEWCNSGALTLNMGGSVASGVMAIGGARAYWNGVDQGAITTNTQQSLEIGIGSAGYGAAQLWAGTFVAGAIYSDTLTGGEIAALTTAINAL